MRFEETLPWLALGAVLGCTPAGPSHRLEVISVRPGEVFSIQANTRFFSVREILVDGNAAWVLDGEPPFLTRVNLDDGALIRIGERGGGPGELVNPRAMQPSGDGGVRVWDPDAGRVSWFDSQGELVRAERLGAGVPIKARSNIRQVSYVDPFRIRGSGDSVLVGSFPRRVTHTADFPSGTIIRADVRLSPGTELIRLRDHVENVSESELEWAAVPLWDSWNGVIGLWSPASRQVFWADGSGEVRDAVTLSWPETRISPRDLERYLGQMARIELGSSRGPVEADLRRMARAVRDRFAGTHPGPVDLRVGSDGVVWLRLFGTTTDPLGKGKRWLRVQRDGLQTAYTFPASFVPFVFLSNGAFGVSTDENGDQTLARWTRRRPPARSAQY